MDRKNIFGKYKNVVGSGLASARNNIKLSTIGMVIIWNLVFACLPVASPRGEPARQGVWNFASCFAASQANKTIKEANKLYQKGKIDEALQKYNEAGAAQPDSDIINFNMGAALYKKEDYQKAQDSFTRALTSDDKKLEADALYNLGNCKYKLGKLKENTDLSSTVGFLREALDYYKRAVEIDQKNEDARFNHEFVERELKVLLDKLKQQKSGLDKQENQQQQEQQKQGSCSTGNNQDADKKEEQSQQPEAGQQQEKTEQGQSEKKEDQKQQEEEQAAREELQQEGENEEELSEQDAHTLLERYGREEASPDYMDKQVRQGYDRQVLKDW